MASSHSQWKVYFRILLVGFFLMVLAWFGIQAMTFWTNKTISEKEQILSGQNVTLASYKSMTGFVKLQAVKELEGKYTETPWSTHIKKVISMLDALQSLAPTQDGALLLSDFNVTLDTMSVKGRVSRLSLLYASSPDKGSVSLIDRFKQLDFVSDIRIKQYTKDGEFFSFVLEAKVNKDGK